MFYVNAKFRKKKLISAERLLDQNYTDDYCLLASCVYEIQRKVSTVVVEDSKIWLTLDTAKIELMKNRIQEPGRLSIVNSNLKLVKSFVYLCFRLCKYGDIKSEIKMRISRASKHYCLRGPYRQKIKTFIIRSILMKICTHM